MMEAGMNKKISLTTLSSLILILACAFPRAFQKSSVLTPSVEPFTPLLTTNPSGTEYACDANIVIMGVDEVDLGDGTKIVHVRIGLENHGSLWTKLRGPDDDEDTETQKSVFVITKDGSIYGFLGRHTGIPPELLPDQNRTLYEERGAIITALIPPGFSILGQTMLGKPHYYGFAFQMPNTQIPDSITIKNMSVVCSAPENSKYSYSDLVETYTLSTDGADLQVLPSADKYPNLVGSKLVMPFEGESIEFTGVTRDGNTVNIVFNYINLSSDEAHPSFNGYIIGDGRLASCQTTGEYDCESQLSNILPVQPGQTAEGLVLSFLVSENETNLMFVYIYGDEFDVNKVYKLNP
jgi:hypothetical protein